MLDYSWGGAKVIQFNYGRDCSKLWPSQVGRISFFWKGVLNSLPTLRGCLLHEVKFGMDTLFWKDCWLNGRAPMYLWPEDYSACPRPDGTFQELIHLLDELPFFG